WQARQDGRDRGRPGGDQRPQGSRRHLRAGDRAQAPTAAGGVEDLVVSLTAKGLTTGEVQAHLAEVTGCAGLPPDDLARSPTECSTAWPSGSRARWTRSTRCCSSTPSTSRSATGRSPTAPCMSCSRSRSTASATSFRLWAGDGGEGAKLLAARPHRAQNPRRG